MKFASALTLLTLCITTSNAQDQHRRRAKGSVVVNPTQNNSNNVTRRLKGSKDGDSNTCPFAPVFEGGMGDQALSSPLVACASTKEKDCGEKLRLLAAGEICDVDEIDIEMGGGEAGPPGPPGTLKTYFCRDRRRI